MCEYLLQFADQLDQIQQPEIYLDKNDQELIRTINPKRKNFQLNKSRVFIIGLKNKIGQSSFHLAILYGYEEIMNLFLQHVDQTGRNYLFEHTDSNIRTPLHLAALKGYYPIIHQLFLFNINVYTRDSQESTPLHCVARCTEMRFYAGRHVSICMLDIFLNYIQNCKQISFDLLTARDGFGHNCLETAILNGNRSFVEHLLNLNNIPLFKNLLRNAQILDRHYHHIDTPLRKLVTYMPELAYRVLDICITYIGEKHKIIYDFQFLEDHCSILQWQKNMNIHRTKPLEFHSQFHQQLLPAYTRDPYILVHNNVLSVMCKCAKQIDLKDQEEEENENEHIQHSYQLMHHPLCRKLMHLKWRQTGLPIFLILFFMYCLYLILFTTIMLKNQQPEYFYRMVNASFPKGRVFNETQLVRFLQMEISKTFFCSRLVWRLLNDW